MEEGEDVRLNRCLSIVGKGRRFIMRLLKRSLFLLAMLAVFSFGTMTFAQSSRVTGQVDGYYCCAIVQYSGDYGTHSAMVDRSYEFGDDANIYYKFGLGINTRSYGKLNRRIGKYSASYNGYYGVTNKKAFSMVLKGSWPCVQAQAKRN